MLDFNMIKFFGIACTGKALRPLPVIWEDESFLHQVGLKLTLLELLGIS